MMVIMSTSGANAGTVYPADRCTWEQAPSSDNRGYVISDASFYPGNAAAVGIGGPLLGYIGKTGRFVAITDPT